jgi:hypothetical protein
MASMIVQNLSRFGRGAIVVCLTVVFIIEEKSTE